MPQSYILSFAKGVTIDAFSEDSIEIKMPVINKKLKLDQVTSGIKQAIDFLASSGATEDALADIVIEKDGQHALAKFYYHLMTFAGYRIINYSVVSNGQLFATLSPNSKFFRFSPAAINPGAKYTLSRYAYLHREHDEMVVESPLSHGKITLYSREASGIITELAGVQTLEALCNALSELAPDTVFLFLKMLLGAGFACDIKDGKDCPEETDTLMQWDFHDLLFHARSRFGRHANPYGGTYRFHFQIEPLPVIKPVITENAISLYRPDMKALRQDDHPFTLVLEERKSIREYAKEPITKRQIGEFLFRSARVKQVLRQKYQDLSMRPYPGGGAIYELELYLTVNACQGISSGFYHYCPKRHVLEKISSLTKAAVSLLENAQSATGIQELPQILITIAARFQRISWKYESMAYSLTLKHVGVLYQTMYLVATAMDLAPCAIGGGDSDLFARAAGLDYYSETSVGEFLVGSKRI